jgi:hypothetical protein
MITKIKDVCQTCANSSFLKRLASAKDNTSQLQGLKEELVQAQLRFIVSAQDPRSERLLAKKNTTVEHGSLHGRLYREHVQSDGTRCVRPPSRSYQVLEHLQMPSIRPSNPSGWPSTMPWAHGVDV